MPPRRVALDALNPNQLDSVGGGRGQKAAGSKWLWAFSQQVIKERTHIIAAPARVVDLMITSLKQPQCLLGSFFPQKKSFLLLPEKEEERSIKSQCLKIAGNHSHCAVLVPIAMLANFPPRKVFECRANFSEKTLWIIF